MREPLFDSSNVLILDTVGTTIMSSQYGTSFIYTTEFETFLASTKDNRAGSLAATFRLFKELQIRELDSNLIRFYPMNNRSTASSLIEFHGEASLVATNADIDHEYDGLGGTGTVYYTTGIDFKTIITDTNNFSVGIYSQTDNDTGTDFGASDGTNLVSISCKSGGDCVMKAGTVTITDSDVTTGKGHFILNVQSGTVKAWQGVSRVLTELGTSTAMAGILPSEGAFLCAYNDTTTATDPSTKRISTIWVYNGLLDDDGITFMNSIVENYHLQNGLSVNYGA